MSERYELLLYKGAPPGSVVVYDGHSLSVVFGVWDDAELPAPRRFWRARNWLRHRRSS